MLTQRDSLDAHSFHLQILLETYTYVLLLQYYGSDDATACRHTTQPTFVSRSVGNNSRVPSVVYSILQAVLPAHRVLAWQRSAAAVAVSC